MSDTPGIAKAGLPVIDLLPGPLVDLARDAASTQGDTTHLSLAEAEAMLADPKYRPLLAALRKQGTEEIRDGQALLRALARFYGQSKPQRPYLRHLERKTSTLAKALGHVPARAPREHLLRISRQLGEAFEALAAYQPLSAATLITQCLLDPQLQAYQSYFLHLLSYIQVPLDDAQATELITRGRVDVKETVASRIGDARALRIFTEALTAHAPDAELMESALALIFDRGLEALSPAVLATIRHAGPMPWTIRHHLQPRPDQGVPWLVQHGLSHRNPVVRSVTLSQLNIIVDEGEVAIAWAIPAMAQRLTDVHTDVRQMAAIRLAEIVNLRPHLAPLVAEDLYAGRIPWSAAGALALGGLGNARVRKSLYAQLKAKSSVAFTILAELGDPEVRAELLKTWKEIPTRILLAAGDPRAIPQALRELAVTLNGFGDDDRIRESANRQLATLRRQPDWREDCLWLQLTQASGATLSTQDQALLTVLQRYPTPQAVPVLRRLLMETLRDDADDELASWKITKALAACGGKAITEELLQLMERQQNNYYAPAPFLAALSFSRDEALVPHLESIYQQISVDRSYVAGAAAAIPGPRSTQFLRHLLSDPSASLLVRSIALNALARRHDAEAIPQALHMLDDPALADSRSAMIDDLGRWRDPRTMKRLLKLATRGPDDQRESALRSLTRHQPGAAGTLFTAMLQHTAIEDRTRALWGLVQLKDRATIASHLRHPNSQDRWAAIRALDYLGNAAAIPALRALQHDPDELVRRQVKEAITKLEYLRRLPE